MISAPSHTPVQFAGKLTISPQYAQQDDTAFAQDVQTLASDAFQAQIEASPFDFTLSATGDSIVMGMNAQNGITQVATRAADVDDVTMQPKGGLINKKKLVETPIQRPATAEEFLAATLAQADELSAIFNLDGQLSPAEQAEADAAQAAAEAEARANADPVATILGKGEEVAARSAGEILDTAVDTVVTQLDRLDVGKLADKLGLGNTRLGKFFDSDN